MRRLVAAILWVLGLAGVVLFAWFDVTKDDHRFSLHIGRPSPWLTYERHDLGFRSEANPLSTGAGAGLLAVFAFTAAVRLGRSGATDGR
jgi:hypothetical protein